MTAMQFGRSLGEYQSERRGPRWMSIFPDGETRIRPLQELSTWITFREHYHPTLRYFPCTEDETCLGCTWTHDEAMSEPRRRYAFTGLSAEGRVNLYKCPKTLADKFEVRARQTKTVMDRDFMVIKSGKGKDTSYDLERGEVYPLDREYPVISLEDAQPMFMAAYEEALERSKELVQGVPVDGGDDAETKATPAEMSKVELQTVLEEAGISFNPRATRDALVAMVEEYL